MFLMTGATIPEPRIIACRVMNSTLFRRSLLSLQRQGFCMADSPANKFIRYVVEESAG